MLQPIERYDSPAVAAEKSFFNNLAFCIIINLLLNMLNRYCRLMSKVTINLNLLLSLCCCDQLVVISTNLLLKEIMILAPNRRHALKKACVCGNEDSSVDMHFV